MCKENDDSSIAEKIETMWQLIDKQMKCGKYCSKKSNSKPPRAIRVFVSSTFTDFFSEREVLIKQVII